MSTDWDVYCADCNKTHGFDDANHCDVVMMNICAHADVLADLAPLVKISGHDIRVETPWGAIDCAWFAEHRGHRLRPRDEYGGFLDQCHVYVACGACGTNGRCTLQSLHSGDCSVEPRQ